MILLNVGHQNNLGTTNSGYKFNNLKPIIHFNVVWTSTYNLYNVLEQNQIINIFTYVSEFYHTKVGFQDWNLQMVCKVYEIK